jgi:hypothetical protein
MAVERVGYVVVVERMAAAAVQQRSMRRRGFFTGRDHRARTGLHILGDHAVQRAKAVVVARRERGREEIDDRAANLAGERGRRLSEVGVGDITRDALGCAGRAGLAPRSVRSLRGIQPG